MNHTNQKMYNNEMKTSLVDRPWFGKISRPSRYMGGEINAIVKDPATVDVTVALAFPDVYEVGMSHLGLKVLYRILNDTDWIGAERVFCPWIDLEREMRGQGLPLATLESDRPLSQFDVLGFSLQNELSYSNILTMLHLSGIPLLSKERGTLFPLVIAGGPACFNPEPVAPIFDAMVIGDGEEAVIELCRVVRKAKARGADSKQDVLEQLARIDGIYIPSFFKVHYNHDDTVMGIDPILSGYEKVRKAIVPDLNRSPSPTRQVVPFMEVVHNRLAVEIARGCTRGCRFCQAGMIYRPVRERDPSQIIRDAEEALRATGFEELSLLSLSSGDYSCIGPLLKILMDRQSKEKVAVSFPSLRIDSLDATWLEQIKRVRKTGFTLAPEAGSDRLRKIINKGLINEEILKMAREVYGAGWNLMKLYFMVGLPGEEEGDIEDIVRLSRRVLSAAEGRGKKANLNVSIALFVPKAHTPFMWVPQISLDEGRRRIQMVQNALRPDRRIRVKWNQPEMSWLEGVFSRGDRRLCRALVEAWKNGARFDAWGERFKKDVWVEALKQTGLDPAFYLYRSRTSDEVFPWNHIESGVGKEYLRVEYEKALQGKVTPDCRNQCHDCGVCDHKSVGPVLIKDWKAESFNNTRRDIALSPLIHKYRITFSKLEHARYISHLELVRLFVRAFRRAGIHFVYSKGFHPMPKISFAAALPVGTESMHETVNIQAHDRISDHSGKELLGRQLPSGIRIISIEDVSHERKPAKMKESHFLITLDGMTLSEVDIHHFLESDHFPVIKKGVKGDRIVDAREKVGAMGLISSSVVKMVLKHSEGPELKPIDILRAVFRLKDHELEEIKILKTLQVMR